MEICDVSGREFKVAILKILNKMWENTDRQFSALRKQINEKSEHFTKEIETLKNNQTEILEMRHSTKEIKNNYWA